MLNRDSVRLEPRAYPPDRNIAATVDDKPGVAAKAIADGVSAQPLARAPGVDHHARRSLDHPRLIIDPDLPPPRRRVGSGRSPRRGGGQRLLERRGRYPVQGAGVAAALECL